MRVFITRNIPDIGPAKLRATGWEIVQWHSDEVIPRATLLEKVKGADAILSLLTERIDGELLEAAGPQLKVVANLAVGFDNFVVGEMTQRHVIGTNTPEVLTDTTADLAWALLMSTARMLPQAQKYVHDGKWTTWGPLLFRGQDIHHATLGLIGVGRIGARWQVDHLGTPLVPGTGHPSRDPRANRRRQNWCSDGPPSLGV